MCANSIASGLRIKLHIIILCGVIMFHSAVVATSDYLNKSERFSFLNTIFQR